ncbi:MAG: chloramphenicol acetyltransferase [Candidatus Riflebacteria bacterium]|nr:chloramphenicol acetyltransferase [Candidatus Riflebacteria bacterium]
MKRLIDIESWNRKEHFEFFLQYDEPFFGITMNLDCTKVYNLSKSEKSSFFLRYLHKILTTANMIEEFRYRIENGKVFCYDKVHVSSTIGRKDGTFAFSFIEFRKDFKEFADSAQEEINRVKDSCGLQINHRGIREDTIHFTSIPWIQFTGLSHSRNFKFRDSCPKMAVGKIFKENEKVMMPFSINAHHAVVDGFHVGKFIELLQTNMNE